MNVNLHGHVIPMKAVGQAGRWGPEHWVDQDGYLHQRVGHWTMNATTVNSRQQREQGTSPEGADPFGMFDDPTIRLAAMDQKHVDIMGLTVTSHWYLYWAEPEIGVPFASLLNDLLLEHCAADPSRLFLMATLPLQDPEACVREVDRVAKLGAKGIVIGGSNLGGRELDDPAFYPLWERVQAHDLPITVHGFPGALATGKEDPYMLTAWMGYLHDQTLAFCNFIYGGVLDEFPRLKIYISHGGGVIPFAMGRMERLSRAVAAVKNKRPFYDYMPNFYLDLLVHDIEARKVVADMWPTENLVMGDNFGGLDGGDGVAMVKELELPEAKEKAILQDNAVRMYKLDQPVAVASAAAAR
jgi:predicted TIM-barrel fold metal-dependent hydrolase